MATTSLPTEDVVFNPWTEEKPPEPPARQGCHLLETMEVRDLRLPPLAPLTFHGRTVAMRMPTRVVTRALCGSLTDSGVYLDVVKNPYGPKCDDRPGGCMRDRCPACVTELLERQMKDVT